MSTKTQAGPAARRSDGRVPLFLGRRALRSFRESGFTLSGALAELIDNSLEAQANTIAVVMEDGVMPSGKRGISRIVVADDGLGMDTAVLSHYLQIGFSTRYMSNTTIGKFGVGAKLAGVGVAQRIDVWSRTRAEAEKDTRTKVQRPWQHVFLQLEEPDADSRSDEEVFIEPPQRVPFPDGIAPIDPKASGTIVVWSQIDRLEEGRRGRDTNRLRAEMQQEVARMFRYFLDGGIKITLNGTELLPYDPLFLMEGTWSDYVLTQHYGPRELGPDGKLDVRHFPAEIITDENINVAGAVARLRVTLYPREVLRRRFMGGDELAEKLRIPGSEGVISFVRLNREINYTVVPRIFPAGIREFDRFIGIEVSFPPVLDAYFGVRNVKRGVEPEDHLRDQIRELLKRHVSMARRRLKMIWSEAEDAGRRGEFDDLTRAVADVDRTMPKGRATAREGEDTNEALRRLARDTGLEEPKEQDAFVAQVKDVPLVLEVVGFPGQSFIELEHLTGQTLIRLNSRHRFYRDLLAPLKRIAEAQDDTITAEDISGTARRAVEALSLMIFAYAKAEQMHPDPHEQYDELRDYWGMFIHHLFGKVKDVI